jgi:hypothetical protein
MEPAPPLLSCPPAGADHCVPGGVKWPHSKLSWRPSVRALRIAEPRMSACRTVEAIEIALRAETHRCKAEGQHTRAGRL